MTKRIENEGTSKPSPAQRAAETWRRSHPHGEAMPPRNAVSLDEAMRRAVVGDDARGENVGNERGR